MGSFESLVFREVLGLGEYDGLVTILGLIAAAFVYFLAPALGYTTYNRGLLLGSMWVLIAKFGLSVFRSGVLFLQAMDSGTHSGMGPSSPEKDAAMMFMLFSMLQAGLFILALALFTGGLASLRRDHSRDRDLPLAPPPPRFPNE